MGNIELCEFDALITVLLCSIAPCLLFAVKWFYITVCLYLVHLATGQSHLAFTACKYLLKKIVCTSLCGAAGLIVVIHGSERANTDIGYDGTCNHFQMWEQIVEQRPMCMASVSCTSCDIIVMSTQSQT